MRSRAPIHSPAAPPNWISGPSRPSEPPEAIANQAAADFSRVTRIDRCTPPSTTASITLPTPPPPRARATSRPSAPATRPPSAGKATRAHTGAARMAVTTSDGSGRLAHGERERDPEAHRERRGQHRDQDHREAEARARHPPRRAGSHARTLSSPTEGGGRMALWILVALALVGCSHAPPLRVGTSGDYAPFSKDGAGFDVDVARLFAAEQGRRARARPVQVARARAVARARRLRRRDERSHLAPGSRRARLDVARGRAGRTLLDRRGPSPRGSA